MTTVYEYNSKELFKDEADAYTIEEIQTHYSQHFAELAQSTYTVIPAKDEEPRRVIFAKKVGTKGADLHPVVAALVAMPPVEQPALGTLRKLTQTPPETVDALLGLGPEINEALASAEALATNSQEATQRCLQLQPIANPRPTLGF